MVRVCGVWGSMRLNLYQCIDSHEQALEFLLRLKKTLVLEAFDAFSTL
jgi:hypothetical protein